MLVYITYIFIILHLSFVQSTHFLGGTISWKPINNTDTSSIISVLFTQSYLWTESATYCNQSKIFSYSATIPSDNETLQCVSTPSLCGGYLTLKTRGYCMDSSTYLESRSSVISNVENITANSRFCVAFRSIYWRTVQSPACSFSCDTSVAKWSIGSCVDLRMRGDGFINTPPSASIISPIKVPVNTVTKIKIPIIDADNDILRCRWAKKTSTFDECGDICGIIPGSSINNDSCIFTVDSTGKTVGDYYAVALMVEDFLNTSMNTSLSSVPVQFLIQIISSSSCTLKPIISSNLSPCTAIQVGVQFNFTVTITQGCSGTTIKDFFRMPPLNMNESNITKISGSNVSTVSETWIPSIEQLGSQIYCVIATDSNNIQSDLFCKTFTVVNTGEALLCPGDIELTTTTTTSSTTSTTTITTSITSGLSYSTSVTGSSTENQNTIVVTVLVPVTSDSNVSSLTYGLGLGLGLPILFLLSGLILYSCCCREQCKIFSAKCNRRFFKRSENNDDYMNSNPRLSNYRKENELPDYREQYINRNRNSQTNNQMKFLNENHSLIQQNSVISISLSDFEPNFSNITKTSLFSPSIKSLPNNDVQFTKDYSLNNINSMNHGSILMHAYSTQNNPKTIYTP